MRGEAKEKGAHLELKRRGEGGERGGWHLVGHSSCSKQGKLLTKLGEIVYCPHYDTISQQLERKKRKGGIASKSWAINNNNGVVCSRSVAQH